MTKKPHEPRSLEKISATESEAWRSSLRFLECAIHLCATHMSMEEVATLLEAEATMLRDLG